MAGKMKNKIKVTDPELVLTYHRPNEEGEPDKRPLQLKLIGRLFGYTRPHARTRNRLFFMVILRSIQLPLVAWFLGAVINGPITHHNWHATILAVAGYGLMVLFTEFTFHFRQKLALQLGESVVYDLRQAVFEHIMRMPLGFFDQMKRGRIISRITSDIESVRGGVQNCLFVALVQTGQMIGAAVMMIFLDATLFLAVLGIGPVIYMLNRFFRTRIGEATRATQESFSRVTATLAESVSGIRVTQGFNREDVNADIFQQLIGTHATFNLNMARAAAFFLPLLELNTQIFTALLIFVGGYLVFHGGMSVGDMIQFFFLAGLFFSPFQVIGNLYNQALTAMAGGERVFRLLDTEPAWKDLPEATGMERIEGRVEFRNVSFEYIPGTRVLYNVDIIAEPGATIALVGHTGSGKSTVTSLLAKFYLPIEGELFIDNREIRTIKADSLHRQMGIIQQENYLFSGTVMENIRLGRPDATDEEVIDAARKLDCLDLIEALQDGFATEAGERGANLSQGQRQIVCFIRAMISNPRILVLDEATSSVDAMTEARIQKSLAMLMQGRTAFVVAHRLSTIRHADQVLVLDHGRIIERGTHLDLLADNGVYTELYRQFIRILDEDDG